MDNVALIYSSNKYLLSIYYVPGTILGTMDSSMNKRQSPYPHGVDILVEKT